MILLFCYDFVMSLSFFKFQKFRVTKTLTEKTRFCYGFCYGFCYDFTVNTTRLFIA